MKASSISELIRKRRSVFVPMFSGEVVDDSVIHEMLENANWAPTHKLTQPWRFEVFTGKGLVRLGEEQAAIYKNVTGRHGNFSEKKYLDLKEKPLRASHIIAISMKRDPASRVPEWEEMCSVAAAVQNMCLTATALGVGSYWGTGGITQFEEAKTLFGLQEEDRFMGFLFVGMPSKEPPEGRRDPLGDRVKWNK